MLKIIRKYQLIILAVGGSLLMVVFLFQPILGKLSPDPRKSAVAKLSDGTTFNGFDFQRASFDLAVLKRVHPRVFASIEQGGLGLQAGSEESTERHWLLLSKQATDAGLIGDAGEGRTWIPVIAQREAASYVQNQAQEGAYATNEQAAQAMSDVSIQAEGALIRNVSLATGMMRGMTEDDVYRTLAVARGIERLYRMYSTVPAYSDIGAIHAAKARYDTVAVDAALIKGELFANTIDEPSQEDLQAFFDLYKADAPNDNEFQIGYTQPARVKLGWLTLDKQLIASGVVINRVELKKTWLTDRNLPETQRKYPGDFPGERLNIEADYRAQRAFDILFEADRIIRSQVLQATRGLSKEGDLYILPEDWNAKRPTLEAMAQAVVDGLKEQLEIAIALPTVNIRTDRWINSQGISTLPGFGSAVYRIGQRGLPSAFLPLIGESEEGAALLAVQPNVPIVDPAAEDPDGNRYYAVIYDINPAGPADSIDDAGRDRVLSDYRTIKAYQMLSQTTDSMIAVAQQANDLAPAIDQAMALGNDEITRPGVARNLMVGADIVARGRLARFVEPGLNTPEFRDAVNQAVVGLNELATPEQVRQSPIIVAVPIPSTKSIGLAKVIAPRPMTTEDFKANINTILITESRTEIMQSLRETGASPFSLDTLTDRYGYIRVKKRKGDDETADDTDDEMTEETESESAGN